MQKTVLQMCPMLMNRFFVLWNKDLKRDIESNKEIIKYLVALLSCNFKQNNYQWKEEDLKIIFLENMYDVIVFPWYQTPLD